MKKSFLLFIVLILSAGSFAQNFRHGGFFPPDMSKMSSGVKENDTIKANLFHVGIDGTFAFKCYVPLSMHIEYQRFLFGGSFTFNPDRGLSGNKMKLESLPQTATVKNEDYYKVMATVDFGYRVERRLLVGCGIGYVWRTDYTNYTGSSSDSNKYYVTKYNGRKLDARFFVHYNMGSFDRWNCYVKAGYDLQAGFLCGIGLQY